MTKSQIVTDPKHNSHTAHPGAKILASDFMFVPEPSVLGVAATIESVLARAEARYPAAIAIYVIIVDRPEGTAIGYEVAMSTEGYEAHKASRAQEFLKLLGTGEPAQIGPCACGPSL